MVNDNIYLYISFPDLQTGERYVLIKAEARKYFNN